MMQILGPSQDALPSLPDAPFLEHILYESPTILIALLIIGGLLALSLVLKTSKKMPVLIAAGVLFMLALGVAITASRVTTDREILITRTAELIASIAETDEPQMRAILSEHARLGHADNASSIASMIPSINSRQRIIDLVKLRLGQPGTFVGSHKVLETRAAIEGTNSGRTLVRVRVMGPGDALIGHSWWEINWKRIDDQWLATRVEAIWIQG